MSGDNKCYSCNQQLYLHDHVILKPCQCIVCPKCLLSAHAVRGTTLLSCGKCGTKVNSHEFVNSVSGGDTVAYEGNTNTLDNEDIYATAAAAAAANNNNATTAAGTTPSTNDGKTSTSTSQEEQKQTSTKTTSSKKPRKRYPRPKCKEEGCNNYVQSKGVCIRHGAPKYNKKCSHPGKSAFALFYHENSNVVQYKISTTWLFYLTLVCLY